MDNKNHHTPQEKDRQLDIPSEANVDKHINFRDIKGADDNNVRMDDDTTERQRQWQNGI
jgi:hypothetical protein